METAVPDVADAQLVWGILLLSVAVVVVSVVEKVAVVSSPVEVEEMLVVVEHHGTM